MTHSSRPYRGARREAGSRKTTSHQSTTAVLRLSNSLLLLLSQPAKAAFSPHSLFGVDKKCCSNRYMVRAPPGSGYLTLEDEESELPTTYEPMMEYPGTMRPGRTPENVPYQDLPLNDLSSPVPWPHFQEIAWHHQWDPPPHDHPIPMEVFIEMNGRWATPEMEAAMRAGVRQSVRERRELQEAEKRDTIITDDEDGDDEPVELGDGIFGQLGSAVDQAAAAAATAPPAEDEEEEVVVVETTATADDADAAGLDDFLLDLGLDLDLDGGGNDDDDSATAPKKKSGAAATAPVDDIKLEFDDDDDDEEEEDTSTDQDDISGLDLEEDDEVDDESGGSGDGSMTVPLEDFGADDAMDTAEDIFDEGGFDFDDGGDFDGGDAW